MTYSGTMKVVIMAAGIGTRLGDIGMVLPKCLVKLNGKTILERQVEILVRCGIKPDNITVVVGEKGTCWAKESIEKELISGGRAKIMIMQTI